MGIAVRNLAAQQTTGTGNGAADVTVKHSLGVIPSFVFFTPKGATQGTLPVSLVSKSSTTIKFRGDSTVVYDILIMR